MLDFDLLVKCQQGDEQSWRSLFTEIYPLSKWVVRHTVFNVPQQNVEEIAQETMIALAADIEKINDELHLKRYVKRVTRNKCIDYIRRNREIFEEVPEDLPAEEDPFVENKIISALHDAVGELKEPCHTIARHRNLLNWSYSEIAEKIKIDIGQIGVRLNRCLAFLKNLLRQRNISEEDIL